MACARDFDAFPCTNDPSAPLGHLPFREDLSVFLPEGEVAAKPTEGSLVRGLEIHLRADSKSIGAETALINWMR